MDSLLDLPVDLCNFAAEMFVGIFLYELYADWIL